MGKTLITLITEITQFYLHIYVYIHIIITVIAIINDHLWGFSRIDNIVSLATRAQAIFLFVFAFLGSIIFWDTEFCLSQLINGEIRNNAQSRLL